jgi:hypothetical protein
MVKSTQLKKLGNPKLDQKHIWGKFYSNPDVEKHNQRQGLDISKGIYTLVVK